MFPRFKSKKRNKNSYSTVCINGNITLSNGYLRLPKIGQVRLKQHRIIPEEYRLKSVTVSQAPSGKYYASILFDLNLGKPVFGCLKKFWNAVSRCLSDCCNAILSASFKNMYSSVFFIAAISFAQIVYVTFVLFSSYCLIFLSSQWLYTILTQPKVLANKIFYSSFGYILNLYALFAIPTLPFPRKPTCDTWTQAQDGNIVRIQVFKGSR